MKKVLIIGGGYSGLNLAINLSKKYDITILDQNDSLGKKILVTGNGRCNFWNEDMSVYHFHSNSLDDISKLISPSDIENAFKLFKKLNIEYMIKNGCYYPYSNKAKTIYDTLNYEVTNNKIDYKLNYKVTSIKKINNKFIINDSIDADILVIASGGKSYPVFGSDGSIFDILKNHTIIKPIPGLTKLYFSNKFIDSFEGVREQAKASIEVDDKILKEEIGEVQFNKDSISGICILNISRDASIGVYSNKKVNLLIDFLPKVDDIIGYLDSKNTNLPIFEMLRRIFNEKLVKIILEVSHIKRNIIYKNLSKIEKEKLASNIKHFKLDIYKVGDYKESEVTIGGVSLDDVNLDGLESKKTKNLYIIGEALDIDGDVGGYNLAFGLISAYKVWSKLWLE